MFKIQSPEDQTKFVLPLTRDTESLYYNTRMIIDAGVLTEPRAWVISKINRTMSKGISVFTVAQDTFNQHTDIPFYDDNGNIKYWIADWKKSNVPPEDIVHSDATTIFSSITSRITYSGNSNQIRIGGSKIFTISFYNDDEELIDHDCGNWSFAINGDDVTDQITYSYSAPNKIKVKISNDDSLIGKILTIINVSGEIVSTVNVEIIAF